MSLSGWKATEIRFAPKMCCWMAVAPSLFGYFAFCIFVVVDDIHCCHDNTGREWHSRREWKFVLLLRSRRKDCSRAQRRKWMKNEIHFDMCDVNWILIEIDLWEKISIFNQIERLERKGQVTASSYLVCLFRRFERCTRNFIPLSAATQCAFSV